MRLCSCYTIFTKKQITATPLEKTKASIAYIRRLAGYYPHKIVPIGILLFVGLAGLFVFTIHNIEITLPTFQVKGVTIPAKNLTPTVPSAPVIVPTAPKPVTGSVASHVRQFGFSAGNLPSLSSQELESQLNDYVNLGVKWIRFDVPWSSVQPYGPNSYDWEGYDRVVKAAQVRKLNIVMLLDYTPAWARVSGCGSVKCAPSSNTQFAAYASTVVTRYAPLGVKHWEIWNEPNHIISWQPTPDAKNYTDLLVKTNAAIKKVDPQSFVLTGGLGVGYTEAGNISPAEFMTGIYKNGGKGSFDGVGHHPYTFPALATLNEDWTGWYQMLSVRSIMTANGDGNKPVWLTEYGAPTNGPGEVATQSNFKFELNPDHVDEALQQQMVSVALGLYKTYSWTGPLFWYGYKDLGTDPGTNENFFGLVRSDGSQKPAYSTFKSLTR